MGILYVCNEKMLRSYMLEAIFNKICTINNVDPYVKAISDYSKIFNELKINLLFDKIRKIIVFK